MAIKTLEIKELESKAANVYEAIVVLSKRSRQINEETKQEFSQRIESLVTLPTSPDEVEDVANPDQLRISLEFEKRTTASYFEPLAKTPWANSSLISEATMNCAFTQPCVFGCASRIALFPAYWAWIWSSMIFAILFAESISSSCRDSPRSGSGTG